MNEFHDAGCKDADRDGNGSVNDLLLALFEFLGVIAGRQYLKCADKNEEHREDQKDGIEDSARTRNGIDDARRGRYGTRCIGDVYYHKFIIPIIVVLHSKIFP